MRSLRLQQTLVNAMIFVDPENYSSTLTVRESNTRKLSSNKTGLMNARGEVITNRSVPVVIPGCTDQCSVNTEVISVRTTISGSIENKLALESALKDHLYNLNLAYPDLISGMLPAFSTDFKTETTVE